MTNPRLHFSREEFAGRVAAARKSLRARELDALLVFAQESLYYLTGFDTNGYVFFQCAVMTADDVPIVLLTRKPDLEQARRTSTIEDTRIWYDTVHAAPAVALREILDELGLKGARVGVELATYGLTAANYVMLNDALAGYCTLVDASDVVRELRLVKSDAELEYVRHAAKLSDSALSAMVDVSGPGCFEGDILAEGQGTIFRGGGDIPASGPVLGSGDRALLIRSSTGPQTLAAVDQLTIEFAAVYRRYHACAMRTLAIGRASARQHEMFSVTLDALVAMSEAAVVGRPLGEIDEAHRRVYDENGYADSRMAACGYSLGATYRPNWMDVPPMLYAGNPLLGEAGMVLFLHAILVDAERGLAMSLGHTIVLRETGAEALNNACTALTLCA